MDWQSTGSAARRYHVNANLQDNSASRAYTAIKLGHKEHFAKMMKLVAARARVLDGRE